MAGTGLAALPKTGPVVQTLAISDSFPLDGVFPVGHTELRFPCGRGSIN
jgi:hypothetical protein